MIGSEADDSVVGVGARRFVIGRDAPGRILGWERLIDALPPLVEGARLETMHRAAATDHPMPWSVYSTAMTVAWLRHVAVVDPSRWPDHEEAILYAAEIDGSVAIRMGGGAGAATIKADLRSRKIISRIRTGPSTTYTSDEGTFVSRDIVPDTIAVASAAKHISDVVDMPWARDAEIRIASATVGDAATTLLLDETLVPLAAIPAAALEAAPAAGPRHAPWLVTRRERDALDAVDVEAHRTL